VRKMSRVCVIMIGRSAGYRYVASWHVVLSVRTRAQVWQLGGFVGSEHNTHSNECSDMSSLNTLLNPAVDHPCTGHG